MTPEEFAAKVRAARGITLTGTPVTPIPDTPIVPTPVQSVPIQPTVPPPVRTDVLSSPGGGPTDPNAPPVRMPSQEAVDAWRQGVPPQLPAQPSPPSVRPLPPMPTQAEPVPYAPPGVSLTSTPAAASAPGWAGTVGMTSPETAQAYDAGKMNEKFMGGLEEMAKGLKPKAPQVQIPNLLAGAPEPNQSNQMASQLMAAIMNKRGLTLTGR